MNYPKDIYNDFEIVEKDIYGEKHYGLVKHYKVFGVGFKRQLKIRENLGFGRITRYGCRWVNCRSAVVKAIEYDNLDKELEFEVKVTK